MLTYRLPHFLDYLSSHYANLYNRYLGRLIELFPSSQEDENNLVIIHDAADTTADDDQIMRLWKKFRMEW